MKRTPEQPLLMMYEEACRTPSDINEHLPLLRELASQCEHVTEMGMRGANGSTIALLAGQPETFIAWDINPYAVCQQQVANLVTAAGRTKFQPRCGDTREITMEQTELLFIDTLHTFAQLKDELARHGMRALKYLAFHDTQTFGEKGEDGSLPGLRSAIRWFQNEHFPVWNLVHDCENNNGLVVLER